MTPCSARARSPPDADPESASDPDDARHARSPSKARGWNKKISEHLAEFLAAHMVPVIKGPEGEPYLTDHHHLARALYEEGVKSVFVTIIADLSRLPADHFWNMMDFHGWTHPYDSKGRRRAVFRIAEDDQDDGGRSLSLAWPANCATSAASPRILRRSRNSSGPISCGRASRRRRSGPTSPRR